MERKMRYAFLCVGALALSQAASAFGAMTLVGQGADAAGTFNFDTFGTWGDVGPATGQVSRDATVVISTIDSKIAFDRVHFQPQAADASRPRTFTVGGESRTLTLSIHVDPLVFDLIKPKVSNLTLSSGSVYQASPRVTISDFVSTPVTGSYSITGPTETVSGNFSIALPTRSGDAFYRVDLTGAPTSATLSPGALTASTTTANGSIFSGTVDGVAVNFGLNRYFVDVASPLTLALTESNREVPEPSTLAVVGGLAGLTLLRRRRAANAN